MTKEGVLKKKVSFLDRLRGKKPPETPEKAVELRFYNPLEAKIGQTVDIDTTDFRDKEHTIRVIKEHRHSIGGKDYFHTDYNLYWSSPDGEETEDLCLRLTPIDHPVKGSGITHTAILMCLDGEFEYDEDFEKEINGGILQVNFEEEEILYRRRNGASDVMSIRVSSIEDENNDGAIEEDEVTKFDINLWDFEKEIDGETEYMFVEMRISSGWFTLWLGKEISQTALHIW